SAYIVIILLQNSRCGNRTYLRVRIVVDGIYSTMAIKVLKCELKYIGYAYRGEMRFVKVV
ncbi:hypothetical protein M2146_003221, partial [Lachnospiraceae bacterium PF1-22]|uniref:hypothetical protein n=1 Tax=Ohessyouella blattaphilus TaxID=2949333 RepID=UPI003E296AF0